MKIRVIGCDGGMAPGKLTTCFQISESLIIDAGSIASGMDFHAQGKIRDIFISHIHLDHVKDLAFLADNMWGEIDTVRIYALPEVNRGLRKFYFNGNLWPDFTKIPSVKKPFYQLIDIKPEEEYSFDSVRIKPVSVNHTVPAVGFILKDETSSVVISGDTGPTERIWQLSQECSDLRGFIVEVAFPNNLQAIADDAKHFTPATLREELPKFERDQIPIGLYHLKPKHLEDIQKEIKTIGNFALKFLHNGEVLQF